MILQMETIKINKIWLYIPDHPCRILVIEGSRSVKTNALPKSIK